MIAQGAGKRQWWRAAWVLAGVVAVSGCSGDGAPKATLVITSTPVADAEVSVDGTAYGPAPVTVEGVAPGSAMVVLEKEGFRRTVKLVHVPEAGGLIEEEIRLNPLVGYVAFKSDPPGAKVYVDGDYQGRTPLVGVSAHVGERTYEYRLDYEPMTKRVTIEEDYRYTRMHVLAPLEAQLSVVSIPTGAAIWLNEEQQAEKTPAKYALSPGAYTVSVHTKGYVMGERNLELGPNEGRVVEIALMPGQAPRGTVVVPQGKFIMGADEASPDERPRRQIELDAFYIDKYEVTNEEFEQVFPSHTYDSGQERLPVTGVSFDQATQYAQAVGKRLPTEAEWEKAARGTDGREYPWGDTFDKKRCNSAATSLDAQPRKVGLYRTGASPYGCMDMAGNAYEWTSSWYRPYPGNPDVTKEYGQVFRVLRGGSFQSTSFQVRCVRRHYDRMDAARDDYGFRCVKDVQ